MMRAIAPMIAAAAILAPSVARAESLPLPAFSVAVDAGIGARLLGYRDDIFDTLRPYRLPAAPLVGGEIALYPGAFATRGPLGWIGVHARAEGMPGLQSERKEHADELPTKAWAWEVALRLRAPTAFGAAWVEAGAAQRAFTIGKAGITDPDVPSVRYLGPHFGLGAEIALPAHLVLAPRGGAKIWTSAGDIASAAWFPQTRAFGVDLGLRFAWAAPLGFAPYLDVAWSRQIVALQPKPGDARVAGGAADDSFAARIGLAWTFAPR
jgi:hypothetical protein